LNGVQVITLPIKNSRSDQQMVENWL